MRFAFRKHHNQDGHLIVYALVFMGILLASAASLVGYTTINVRGARQAQSRAQALYLAEAGVEKAVYELNQDSNYSGESNTALGNGTFTVAVSTVGASTKRITATGHVSGGAGPAATRVVHADVEIDAASISFNTGVQVATGGLAMENGSKVIGNVFSNGAITGGNAEITGDVIIARGTSGTPDQSWEVQNTFFAVGNAAARQYVAQSFVPNSTNTINKVRVYIRKIGAPGDLTARIMTSSGTNPSKTVLATKTVPASSVTGNFGWVEATFPTPPNLSAGVTYWIMLSTATVNASNYYAWGMDNNNGYGNGVGKYSTNWNASTPVWTNVGGDLNYQTYMGGAATFFDGDIAVGGSLRAAEIRNCGSVAGGAFYDTVFNSCPAASSTPGSAIPGPEAMPISDAQAEEWKQTAEAGGVITGNHTVNGFEILGPVKIDGDLVINGNATLHLTGPVWVKGSITTYNNTTIRVDPVLGNSGTVLLADNPDNLPGSGIITISNNTVIEGNGNPGSFPLIVSTSSNLAGAIHINNNAIAAVYYAENGSIELSNNAGGNQITGYKIHLNNNATITYSSGLQNALFSNGPGGSWKFAPGTYVVD